MSFFRDYYIGVTEKYIFVQVRDLIYTLLMYLGNHIKEEEDEKNIFLSYKI